MDYFANYGLFLAETATIVIAVLIVVAGSVALTARSRGARRDHLEVRRLNERYQELQATVAHALLNRKQRSKALKQDAKAHKARAPLERRVFVLDFHGDIRASGVDSLREEITALLTVAEDHDEVIVRLESPGGMVPHYGLAASQLARIRERGVRLTVAIDRVAASGGYLMACVADHIIAAPFAIIGSIGVVAQVPNFHRLLKRNDIDYEQLTAGEYKRTLSVFGEITDKGREKALEELNETHQLFKGFIARYRPHLDVDSVATGEYWLGERALALGLVDANATSDDYLLGLREQAELLHLRYRHKPSLRRKLSIALDGALARLRGLG